MRLRAVVFSIAGLSLLFGFQNCSAPTTLDSEGNLIEQPTEKASLSGRYSVSEFISTSSCPDIEQNGIVCSAIYKEDKAKTIQFIEFMPDGSLMLEGSCNTYYANYVLSSSGSIGRFKVDSLSGTSKATCSAEEAEEESILVYRLGEAVRIVEEGPKDLAIYTDQSSAFRLIRN